MSDLTMTERVEIGVRFLNETVPNWRNVISVESLDLSTCALDPLGQLYGWSDGLAALAEWADGENLPDDEPLCEIAGFEKVGDTTYPQLQDEWKRVIANKPECDGCDQDPWRNPVHYGTCPLAPKADSA